MLLASDIPSVRSCDSATGSKLNVTPDCWGADDSDEVLQELFVSSGCSILLCYANTIVSTAMPHF